MRLAEDLHWLRDKRLERVDRLKREMLENGEQLIDLSMINPDLAPPRLLQDRLVEACVKPSNHRYSVSRGIRKLREGFAEKYSSCFAVNADPEHEICITMGAKDGFAKLLRIFAPDARVLLTTPTYPMHLDAVRLHQLAYDFVALSRDPELFLSRLQSKLEETHFDVLLLNFPNNPTGISFCKDFYKDLLHLCRQKDVVVLNDFVYGEITRDVSPAASLLSSGDDLRGLVEVYSLSKVLSIPGWRVAGAVGDRELIGTLSRLKKHADYGIFLPLQLAACGILSESADYARQVAREYGRRAQVLVEGLTRIGWEVSLPNGGASVWAAIPDLESDSMSVEFAVRLLRDEKVVVLPGDAFGQAYSRFVRFSLVRPEHELREVLKRLQRFQLESEKFEESEIATHA